MLARLVPLARRARQRWDNPEVRAARHLARRLSAGPLDVLLLGESTTLFTGPDDRDTRTLDVMVADELGPGTSTHTIAGGGYGPALLAGYVRLLRDARPPPLVVVPLSTRFSYEAWSSHPVYGYARAIDALQRIDHRSRTVAIRASFPRHSEADLRWHDRTPHRTLAGRRTVGEHRRALREPAEHGLSEHERVRLLFGYHHGAAIDPDADTLRDVTALGALLREVGCPVVAYQTAVPVQRGDELYGPAFGEQVRENLRLVAAAFLEGYPGARVLPTGSAFATADFIDPDDATEHLNEHGRLRLARTIADAVRALR